MFVMIFRISNLCLICSLSIQNFAHLGGLEEIYEVYVVGLEDKQILWGTCHFVCRGANRVCQMVSVAEVLC